MNVSEEKEIKKEFQLERVVLFSDAVFAIIITIMVLDIRVPESLRHANADEIKHAFGELIPKILAYCLSFFLVARYWQGHLKMFSVLKDYDTKLLGLNLFYLFSVTLFPFAVTLISGNINPEASIYVWGIYIYSGVVFLSTISQALLTRYLMKNREKLCFDTDDLDSVLKYKVMRANFIIVPVVIIIMFALSYLGFTQYYALSALAIYGFLTSVIEKNYYPESTTGPIILKIFKRRNRGLLKKAPHKKVIVKK